MDNITHSLTGAAIAEAYLPRTKNLPRGSLILASALANNGPDFEALWTSFIMPGKLGYLLFHRGHSHTLLGWPLISLFFFVAFFLYMRVRGKTPPREYWKYLGVLCLIGPPMHIFLDFVGNYGVHPFWPWNNSWIYGDAVFIIDPFVWFTYAGALAFVAANRWMKSIYGIQVALSFALMIFLPFIPWIASIFQVGLGVALLAIFYKTSPRLRMRVAAALLICFFAASFLVSASVRKSTVHSIADLNLFPPNEIQDVILSPYPANPLCWRTLVVRSNEDEDLYEIWSGFYSLFANAKEEDSICSLKGQFRPNVEIDFLSPVGNEKIQWLHTWRNELSTFRELRNKSCHFEAFLYYARAPAWKVVGDKVHISDLRYDRNQAT